MASNRLYLSSKDTQIPTTFVIQMLAIHKKKTYTVTIHLNNSLNEQCIYDITTNKRANHHRLQVSLMIYCHTWIFIHLKFTNFTLLMMKGIYVYTCMHVKKKHENSWHQYRLWYIMANFFLVVNQRLFSEIMKVTIINPKFKINHHINGRIRKHELYI